MDRRKTMPYNPPPNLKISLDHHFWKRQCECTITLNFISLYCSASYIMYILGLLVSYCLLINVQYPQPQSNITSDSIKYSALLIICILGPLNKPISYAKYLFSFQYLTGVISPIVINQKIKIKSDHQDHGSSHCFRSRVHWDRYTILYILVYILRLIF